MDKSETALYTRCGHSIKSLREEARKLADLRGIRLGVAQDSIARELKYSDWRELIQQPSNPVRDGFFRSLYANRLSENVAHNYAMFLSATRKSPSKDAYREFTLHEWEGFCSAGLDNVTLRYDPLHPIALKNVLQMHLAIGNGDHVLNGQGLLPCELSEPMLEWLCYAGRASLGRDTREIPESVSDEYQQVLCTCLIVILMAKHADSGTVEFPVEVLWKHLQGYWVLLELELIGRRSKVVIAQPTLDTIFEDDHEIDIALPDNPLTMP